MSKKVKDDSYKPIIELLLELKKLYPSYSLGRHISTALSDYGDVWGTTDKEILFAFIKYKAQLEMDVPHEADDEELRKIIEDGMNLNNEDNTDYEGQYY